MDAPNRKAQDSVVKAIKREDPDAVVTAFRPSGNAYRAHVNIVSVGNFRLRDLEQRLGYGAWFNYAVVSSEEGNGIWVYVPFQKTHKHEAVRSLLTVTAYVLIVLGTAVGGISLGVARFH
jgi:hypothetical protein